MRITLSYAPVEVLSLNLHGRAEGGDLSLLSTHFKDRLPQALAYPLGTEVISQALADIPQFDTLKLSFWNRATIFQSQQNKLWSQGAYPVMKASFRHHEQGYRASNALAAQGGYDDEWLVSVYAVSCEEKPRLRAALRQVALPRLRQWFLAPRTPVWLQRSHSLFVFWDQAAGELSFNEPHS